MMKLRLSSLTPVNFQPKLPICGLARSNHEQSTLKLPSLCPSLSVSNSKQPQHPIMMSPPVHQSVAAIVFGDDGSSESGLYPLTITRSKGAIPIAANYRLIDPVISNCINSNVSKIYAITQFNSTSLNSHLSRAYSGVGLRKEGFLEVIAAYQSPEDQGWFRGTADAIRRCLWVFEEHPVTEFLFLPGHHLYRMDYQKVVEAHRKSCADITIVALSSPPDTDPGFGLLDVDPSDQVTKFRIKSDKEHGQLISVECTRKNDVIAHSNVPSTGICLISRDKMVKLLKECFPLANNLAIEVIPGAISVGMKVKIYKFDGYWEDMKSIGAFYRANMECIKKSDTGCSFYDNYSPLYTLPRCLPPSTISEAVISDSVIGDGCILNRCIIKGSVVGMRTRVADEVVIEDSVIMGSDIYETGDVGRYSREGKEASTQIGIGEHSRIRKALVDKNARIGKNVMIINKDKVQEGEREAGGYIIREGIVVVLRGAVIPDDSIV